LEHLYDEIDPPATPKEEATRQVFLVNARQLLGRAKAEQAKADAEFDAKYAGMTPDEMCNAQVAEMVERAGNPGPDEGRSDVGGDEGPLGEVSDEDTGMGEGTGDLSGSDDDLPQRPAIDSFFRNDASFATGADPSSDVPTVPDYDQVMSDSPPHE